MDALEIAKEIVKVCLQQGDNADIFDASTPLMGAFPEFNSMTIVTMVGSIEEQLGCEIDDDELSAEIFETIGTLAEFIESKF